MAAKNKSSTYYNVEYSDSEDDYDVRDSETNLGLSLEKLSLGPRKKLLVMNLNGLLLHRANLKERIPKSRRPDGRYGNFVVFRRPFSEEFMKFCLERFEVGIWSSAMERNIDAALNYAIGPSKNKDQDRCTDSGFESMENKSKPLFFKELEKVWEIVKKGGPYSASNTLLIDDKPYKAFLNTPNTAIFPESYKPEDEAHKALDPKGELCSYLKGLVDANDVQSYVKEHPFGQPAITSSYPDWDYYSKVQKCLRKDIEE